MSAAASTQFWRYATFLDIFDDFFLSMRVEAGFRKTIARLDLSPRRTALRQSAPASAPHHCAYSRHSCHIHAEAEAIMSLRFARGDI